MKPAYKVDFSEISVPIIHKVDVTDVDGVSWRDAKKQLRKYFTDHAKNVRAFREKDVV